MKNFVQPGKMIDVTATAAVSSGDVVVVGDMIGVASVDAAIGEKFALAVWGVFEVAKEAAAISEGAKVYWDAGDGEVKASSGGGAVPMGYCVGGALVSDAKIKVALNQF